MNGCKKQIMNKWWYIWLWRINRKRKIIKRYIQALVKVLPLIKDKNKKVDSDYDITDNVKLYYWRYDEDNEKNQNLGDFLSKIVVDYFAPKSDGCSNKKTKTLYAIGSILGFRCQDAVVWGSGLISSQNFELLHKTRFSCLDIRAVRGPKTREKLLELGKKCPMVYGDPAILMPKIYQPEYNEKKYDVSVVLHYVDKDMVVPDGVNKIEIITDDYKKFIDEIVASKLIISSSLHGIILAETYGVPAVFLNTNGTKVPFKYEDWYNSTNRYDIIFADTLESALTIKPMLLPDLKSMQENLLAVFPYDLWA